MLCVIRVDTDKYEPTSKCHKIYDAKIGLLAESITIVMGKQYTIFFLVALKYWNTKIFNDAYTKNFIYRCCCWSIFKFSIIFRVLIDNITGFQNNHKWTFFYTHDKKRNKNLWMEQKKCVAFTSLPSTIQCTLFHMDYFKSAEKNIRCKMSSFFISFYCFQFEWVFVILSLFGWFIFAHWF